MPKNYHHLAFDQRCQIFTLLQEGNTQTYIAKVVGVNQSSISRELGRNSMNECYEYKKADEKAKHRRKQSGVAKRKVTKEVRKWICKGLKQRHTPEVISESLKLRNIASVSHETIYKYIRPRIDLFREYVRRKGKAYLPKTRKKGPIKNRVGIEQRPKIVDEKQRVGDLEADTIVGAKHRSAIVSLVDRRTKLVKLMLITYNSAAAAADAITTLLRPLKEHLHTITADNGSEFAAHEDVTQELGIPFYFAHPHSPWERGLNENTNGLVRQYFPKGTDFTKITQHQVRMVEEQLNNRPRKTLGYRTPNEVFSELTGVALISKNIYALQG